MKTVLSLTTARKCCPGRHEIILADDSRSGVPTGLEGLEAESSVKVAEVTAALKRLKSKKAGAEVGLVAEMLETGHAGLTEALVHTFADILAVLAEPPEYWKKTELQVIPKAGDLSLPKNYRPIFAGHGQAVQHHLVHENAGAD